MLKKFIVLVTFGPGGKKYAYFTYLSDLEVGDLVVVETPRQHSIVTVVQVDNISTEAASHAAKWIVDVVDLDTHKQMMQQMEA